MMQPHTMRYNAVRYNTIRYDAIRRRRGHQQPRNDPVYLNRHYSCFLSACWCLLDAILGSSGSIRCPKSLVFRFRPVRLGGHRSNYGFGAFGTIDGEVGCRLERFWEPQAAEQEAKVLACGAYEVAGGAPKRHGPATREAGEMVLSGWLLAGWGEFH